MQTFYDQLVSSGEKRESKKSWLSKVNQLSLEQVASIRDSVLDWVSWTEQEA